MIDAQIVATSITVLAVLAGSVFTNVRIGDLNRSVNLHLDDLTNVFRSVLLKETSGIRNMIERNQDALLTELTRIDQRVTRLEDRMH